MSDIPYLDFEAEFWADDANVRGELCFDGLTIRFMASPAKYRMLAAAMLKACDEAEGMLPKL